MGRQKYITGWFWAWSDRSSDLLTTLVERSDGRIFKIFLYKLCLFPGHLAVRPMKLIGLEGTILSGRECGTWVCSGCGDDHFWIVELSGDVRAWESTQKSTSINGTGCKLTCCYPASKKGLAKNNILRLRELSLCGLRCSGIQLFTFHKYNGVMEKAVMGKFLLKRN